MAKKIKIKIGGMHCASCAALVEKCLLKAPGVSRASVSYASETANISLSDEELNVSALEELIKGAGYQIIDSDSGSKEQSFWQSSVFISLMLSLPLLYLMLLSFLPFLPGAKILPPYAALISLILTTPIQFIIGRPFYQGFFSNLRMRSFGMDTLVALGTSAAYFYSLYNYFLFWQEKHSLLAEPGMMVPNLYFETAAFLITFVLLGKYLEQRAKTGSQRAISKLLDLQVKTARVFRQDTWQDLSLAEIKVGDRLLVRPGEKVPVDGQITEGHSLIDESLISGESLPQEKKLGDLVIGSTINKNGSFEFVAKHVGQDTVLARIVALVEEAQGSKAPIQDFADRVAAVFVPIIVSLAFLSFLVWYFVMSASLSFSLMTFVAVIVIACPCALGLATPMAIMVATARGAKQGILIKGGEPLQIAASIKTIVFDKTGTLTKGQPTVQKVQSLSDLSQDRIIALAASLEQRSEHPLAEAIINYYTSPDFLRVDNFTAHAGYGLSGEIAGQKYFLGNARLMKEFAHLAVPNFDTWEQEALTLMYLADDMNVLGVIAVSDPVKDGSKEAVAKLLKSGFSVYLLSGDNLKTAQAIASELGIKNVLANVLPAQKAAQIKLLQAAGQKVAMVGDGVNDAPALAQADLAIVMGSGADVSLDIGGIVIISNDLRDIAQALGLAGATMSKIKQNLFFALFYNVLGIPLAARLFVSFGLVLNPELAGLAMVLSSLSVVLSSLTLRNYKVGAKKYTNYLLLVFMLFLFLFFFWEFARLSVG